ncbi:unnamed protein product [Meganyctiphanes norvegica]|uniref:Nuclear receptor domain-containing protein n=1 Tax=Meganyctiphanes norvegica TaxID=48144 RepID=A0AAV2SGV8_MEGNR
MNQLCKVCAEPAAGFHFGAFTCEGCKSFFGRTYNNLSQVHECKNGGQCIINKQNRTSCKACRLRKCLMVGMSKSGSRYGRRSNWFKIHCLLQEQAAHMNKEGGGGENTMGGFPPGALPNSFSFSPASMPALSPAKSEEDQGKFESPVMSSPESYLSETSTDVEPRRTLSPKDLSRDPSRERFAAESMAAAAARSRGPAELIGAAGLSSLYGLHPGLSLLHASHLYSRLYPPMLYPGLAPPLMGGQSVSSRPPLSPPHEVPQAGSPHSPSPRNFSPPGHYSPGPSTPTTLDHRGNVSPASLPLLPSRKRCADSPVDHIRAASLSPQAWEAAPAPEQDAPIDLSFKRPRIETPSPTPPTPVSPPASPTAAHTTASSTPTSTTPVDLTQGHDNITWNFRPENVA